MTSSENYPTDTTESRPQSRKKSRESSYLPPAFAEQFDKLGRLRRLADDGDGRVKPRPTNSIAKQRLKSLRIERALENEALNAAMAAAINVDGRRERLTAPTQAICNAVVAHFKRWNVPFQELRDTKRHRGQEIVSYARRILFEIQARHGRISMARFADWLGCDHTSISYARAKTRAQLGLGDQESRALKSDLDAITVALSIEFDWGAGGESRADMIQRLLNHAKEIAESKPRIFDDIVHICNLVQQGVANA